MKNQKIAIVYDWIDKWGGVERVLLTLHEMFPEAVFYTSYYDKETAPWAKSLDIKTSFIQKLPSFIKKSRLLSLLLYPLAFETFDFSGYDTVISVTSSFAKGVITKPQTKHICYLLTPTRYIWGQKRDYLKNSFLAKLGDLFLHSYLERWDFIAAQRVDSLVSISKLVKERCTKYYERDSQVIYPPFDEEYWEKIKKDIPKKNSTEQFFLIVSRLESYKKVDLAIKAFNKMKKNLVIIGTGTEEEYLEHLRGNRVTIVKNITDEELAILYTHAEALIMPQEEDFGYVALEAQFFGCPVISYAKSGAAETILEGKTGILFSDQTVDVLTKTVSEFDIISNKLKASCRDEGPKHIKAFSNKLFKDQFTISKL